MGFLAGFLGAIPPGPLGVTCLRKSLQGERRDAYRVAFGGASVDTLICALIGLGLGWILEKVVTNPWVKGTLALFLVGYGAKLVFVDARRDAERVDPGPSRLHFIPAPASPREGRLRFPVLTGLLQGAANPALFLNWTLFISFLVGHRLFVPTAAGAGGFALGVGLGVFSWFTVLIQLVDRWRNRAGAWVSRSTLAAGALLVVFGIYFTWRSFKAP
jgi:threonine/homoserine/homoserine lactone efflux protein